MNYHCKGYKHISLSMCSGDKLDCSILRSNIKEKQSTQKMRHLMRRDRERGREQFTTAVSTHIQSTESADVGGERWCARQNVGPRYFAAVCEKTQCCPWWSPLLGVCCG